MRSCTVISIEDARTWWPLLMISRERKGKDDHRQNAICAIARIETTIASSPTIQRPESSTSNPQSQQFAQTNKDFDI